MKETKAITRNELCPEIKGKQGSLTEVNAKGEVIELDYRQGISGKSAKSPYGALP